MQPFSSAKPRSSPLRALSTGNLERTELTGCGRRTAPTSSEPSSSSEPLSSETFTSGDAQVPSFARCDLNRRSLASDTGIPGHALVNHGVNAPVNLGHRQSLGLRFRL